MFFLNKYNIPKNIRFNSFKFALEEAFRRNLKIIVETCNKSLPEDPPENSAFIQIWNQKLDKEEIKIFSGWMFSSSPSISALDHAVYDVWVIDCMSSYIED